MTQYFESLITPSSCDGLNFKSVFFLKGFKVIFPKKCLLPSKCCDFLCYKGCELHFEHQMNNFSLPKEHFLKSTCCYISEESDKAHGRGRRRSKESNGNWKLNFDAWNSKEISNFLEKLLQSFTGNLMLYTFEEFPFCFI